MSVFTSLKLYLLQVARCKPAGWFIKKLRGLTLADSIEHILFLGFPAILVFLLSWVAVIGVLERYRGGTQGFPITHSFVALIKILYLLTCFGMLTLASLYWQDLGRKRALQKRLGNIQTSTVRILMRIVLAVGVMFVVARGGWWIVNYLTRTGNRIAAGVSVVTALSLILYWVRCKALVVYAIAEIIFAFLFCASTLASMGDFVEPVKLLSLITSIYLFIRGLDNLGKGIKAPNGLAEKLLTGV